jgi:LAO/AO transport system kinase
LLGGDRGALARMITWAENRDQRFGAALSEVYGRVGRAWRVGVTGPPGAGKSTLVNELARLLRARDETVGVLAVDPSSPFSGGALLGDRIRMEDRTLDRGVFIRSMASRGSHGGLARAAVDACDVMDAFGLDRVVLETVGVGQAEYDVLDAADTVVVVLCPGAGDGVQAMKAGLLEVADVLVVNKADLEGADRLINDLVEAVHVRFPGLRSRPGAPNAELEGEAGERWSVPVVACSAGTGFGVEDVLAAVDAHRAHLEARGLEAVRRSKRVEQVRHGVQDGLADELFTQRGWGGHVRAELERAVPPHRLTAQILDTILGCLPEAPAAAVAGGLGNGTATEGAD